MRRINILLSFVVPIVILGSNVAQVYAADTLVVKSKTGKYTPGIAKSWKADKNSVVFVLVDKNQGPHVLTVLQERLTKADVKLEGSNLRVIGIAKDPLLEQLSQLSFSAEADPLLALAGVGVGGSADPEAGSSIRVARPISALPEAEKAADSVNAPANPQANIRVKILAHDPNEEFCAEVVSLKRENFPFVTLTLKVKKSAKSGFLKDKITTGSTLEAPVIYYGEGSAVSFDKAETQQNLVAQYLVAGDRICVHAVIDFNNKIQIDWLERQR